MSLNRRNFLKLSSLSLLSIISCTNEYDQWAQQTYDITLHSDMSVGHLIFKSSSFPQSKKITTENLIIGGGVAGVTAAYQLRDREFMICELSDRLGGSSASQSFNGKVFAQGAHYDLSYPDYFGEETLQLFEGLNIIQFNPLKALWQFVDRQYIINGDYETQCLMGRKYIDDVLPEGASLKQFLQIVDPYLGKMKLPTRLIDPQYHHLNQQSFADFLNQSTELPAQFFRSIDHQMLDDFSGTSSEVSALAGLYYYASRPYGKEDVDIFSPPEGNYYFVRKIAEQLPQESILLRHVVSKIVPNQQGFEVTVVDVLKQSTTLIQTKNIVYAGQKHALKYIYPQDYPLFSDNEYAPWMVINLIMENKGFEKGFWQNELLSEQRNFMGFVDADSQYNPDKDERIFTVYYCFPSWYRKQLSNIEKTANQVISQTLSNMSVYYGKEVDILKKQLKKSFIKVMGHAMPIPKPNYLFQDRNTKRSHPHLVYAGVDNGRLPLLLEAVDSGMMAVKALKEV